MAADYKQMMQNFSRFYDFTGKEVVGVGIGGGRLIELSRCARRMIAIDNGLDSIRQLETKIAAKGLQKQVDIVYADFCETSLHGDVVYFEFSLHEMDDPEKALRHASGMAPDVLIADHLPGSAWAYQTLNEDKVRRSTNALAQFDCIRHQAFRTEQYFEDHAQLMEKVSSQGELAVHRARQFAGRTNITIPMTYGLTLLAGTDPRPASRTPLSS